MLVHPRVALDTSAYSHFRRGQEDVLEWLAGADIVVVPAIVLGELEAGFELGRRRRANRQALADFLDEPFVEIRPVTPAVAIGYGRLFAELRRAGTPIPVNDIWIAASAIEAQAHLLTFDTDYAVISGLEHTLLTP